MTTETTKLRALLARGGQAFERDVHPEFAGARKRRPREVAGTA
jgi:hypothetical protein